MMRCLCVSRSEICLKSGALRSSVRLANGKEAIALYDQLKPDLVTMDVTMPIMTGIEATKMIVEKDTGQRSL